MRNLFLGLGVLLLFTGIIMASSSNLPLDIGYWSEIETVNDQWELTGNLREGSNVTLDILWFLPTEQTDIGTTFNGTVTFVSPDQGETNFKVRFELVAYPPPELLTPTQEKFPLQVTKIELISLDSDSLSVSTPTKQIGGIVKQSGFYTVSVNKVEWLVPPTSLRLLVEKVERQYPYTYLLPIGASCGVFGVLGMVFAAWRTSGKRKRGAALSSKPAEKKKKPRHIHRSIKSANQNHIRVKPNPRF